MEDAGKVRVVVEVGGLEEVRLLQPERRGKAAQEGPEKLSRFRIIRICYDSIHKDECQNSCE